MCCGSKFSYTFSFSSLISVSSLCLVPQTTTPFQLSVCSEGNRSLSLTVLGALLLLVLFQTGSCTWFWLLNVGLYNGIMFAEPASIHLLLPIFGSTERQMLSQNDLKLLLRLPPRMKYLTWKPLL